MTKTNTRSRIVSILLVLMMLLTMVPITAVTASAAEPEWTTVNSFDELKKAMQQGTKTNIKLGKDINTNDEENHKYGLTTYDQILAGNTITLDLNGKKLTLNSGNNNIGVCIRAVAGSLTVQDSVGDGEILLNLEDRVSPSLIQVEPEGTFTLKSGTLRISSPEPDDTGVTLIKSRGTVNIEGGTLTCEGKDGSIGSIFGDPDHWRACYALRCGKDDNVQTTITGGEFIGMVRTAVMNNGKQNKITNCKIEGNAVLDLGDEKNMTWAKPGITVENATINGTLFVNGVCYHEKSTDIAVVIGDGQYDVLNVKGNVWLYDYDLFKQTYEAGGNDVSKATFKQGYAPYQLKGGTYGGMSFGNKGEYDMSGKYIGNLDSYIAACIEEAFRHILGNGAIKVGDKGDQDHGVYTYKDIKKSFRANDYMIVRNFGRKLITFIPNAWGMKSITLDGNPIDYAKDWKGAVERMDNSTAHTIKFEWYPLASELVNAGYSYRIECDRYISGNNTPTTDTISATDTQYSFTIPAGADPKVYSFDLKLNLNKNGSSVGIYSNEHIVKLVISEAPVVEPDPTIEGNVYYTSGIVYGSPISTAASVTPAEATKSYQWQRSTDGGSTWTNIEGATSGKYTPVAADMGENVRIRVKVTAEGYLGEIIGAALKVSKAANNNYPEVIKLEAVKNGAGNYTGFKITNFDSDYEYVYSTTDTPNWSANQISSATVTGLTSDTTYYVFARFKETATHTAGSIVSNNSIKLYDHVPLDRVLLEGYGSHGTIYIKKGESVTLKVSADPSNANYWSKITFKDSSVSSLGTSNITISNEKIAASGTTATAFPNDHSITITGVSTGSATLDASYSGPTQPYYGRWYVVVYDDSTVANALRLENVYAYEDITLSVNDEAGLPTDLPKLLPENSGYHLEWRIIKSYSTGFEHLTQDDNITLEDGKIKPKAAHAASGKTQLELVAVKDGSTEYKTLPKTSLFYVTVTEAPVIELTGITVAPTKVNLDIGDTITLSAVKQPVNADGILSWASDNPRVATVDNTGRVIAQATPGTATITVSCGTKSASCTVTVGHTHDYNGQPYLYLDPGSHYQECKTGDSYNIQAHEFTPWTDNENGTHSRHCTVCKMTDGSTYTETAEHTWVWVVDQEAALNQPGKQHEECTGCHAKRSENTEIPALRDYAVTVTGGTATVAAGTTITRAMEGVEVTVTAQAPGGKHFVKWVVKAGGVTLANETSATTTFIMPANDVTIEAEFAENPVEAYTLTVIKGTASVAAGTPITDKIEQNTVVTITADAPETGKVFDKWVVLEGNVTLADATKATTTFTMPGNDVKIEATYKDAPPSHTHSYGTEWKYDGTNHWHECACGDKADIAAHSASEWIVDTAATETTDGAKHKECTVCKKVLETATIPATGSSHTHSYGTDWKYDGTNHWHECACGNKADTAAHSFQWVIDKAATKEATGTKHEECTVCGAKRSENTVIDKLPDSGNTGNTGSGDNNTNKPGKDDSTKSPQTGDNSNLIGWLAALFVSGGVLTVLGLNGKKRKESEAE